MTQYLGKVKNGVIILEEGTLPDGTEVRVVVVNGRRSLREHPACGIWRDRDDMPDTRAAAERLRRDASRRNGQ